CSAMYHDISEIVTGDLPTPVKYKNERIRREYKSVEHEAEIEITDMLPDSVKETVRKSVTGEELNERERRIIKSADKLSALIKCMEEENNGNTEFKSAKKATETALEENMLPETKYFIKNFLPAYELTLDELMKK
ncbi:MAG: 5'-deoxynucleotidase, partial [Ruminococcaceae bacterium]|nr:5'-deoxynucleotidase [Oscillospiraceae bacterium]